MHKTIVILILLVLSFFFHHCLNNLKYEWRELAITVYRTFSIDDKQNYSEPISNTDLNSLPIIGKEIFKNKSPYPLEIVSSRWKFIETYDKDSLNIGFQIIYENKLDAEVIFISIPNTEIKIYDKDGFLIKSFYQQIKTGIPFEYLFVEEGDILKSQFRLAINEAKRVANCEMYIWLDLYPKIK